MNQAKHIYVVYIATTAEKLWKAITQGELAKQYWMHENVSDWKVGSRWSHVTADAARSERIVGKVLEVTPPTRLVMSWADPKDAADPSQHSRVTFDIEPIDEMVKLTVTHDELVADSNMERGITRGWPLVLSSMKSFLETGKGLDIWATKKPA
jgi:uncharacterized protein YndB with AHSA1/START domain